MQNRLPKVVIAGVFALLVFSFLSAAPARAVCGQGAGECLPVPYSVPAEPVWATLNAVPQGNYPGGNEIFDITVVNSDVPPAGNLTLFNETVSSPQLPPSNSNPNFAIGLSPALTLTPGQLIVNTIAMEIPSNYTQSNFTANLVAYVSYWNGTLNVPLKLTGSLVVYMLGLPISGGQTTGSTSTVTATQTVTSTGGVSSSLFAVGVGVPLIVVVVLLVLLARGRGAPKG